MLNVFKIDAQAITTKFLYDNNETTKYNLVSTVMSDYYKVPWFNETVRHKVEAEIQHNGNHLVWSAKTDNIHYLAVA